VPLQIHLELWIDNLDETEGRLQDMRLSAPRDQGNVVMLDPAGHPFCIGTRV
jgi:hypothetical protein